VAEVRTTGPSVAIASHRGQGRDERAPRAVHLTSANHTPSAASKLLETEEIFFDGNTDQSTAVGLA
jgi:hypothetical protein